MTHAGIECFLAVCRHKTGSRAAQALYITQSSLSTRLKTLERELGGPLFYRKNGCREMTLTPAGKEFYSLALQYEELVEKMQKVCRSQPKSLRVSSINSLGTYLLPAVYTRFLQQHPTIQLDIQDMKLPEVSHSIRNGETDLALTAGKASDSFLVQTPIFSEPMVLICSRQAAYPESVTAAQLPHREEVYIDWNDSYARWHQKTFGNLPSNIRVSIMAHLKQFMDSGHYWAIVPVSVAEELCKDGIIRYLQTDIPLPRRTISILTAADTDPSPALVSFWNACARSFLSIRILR